MLFNILSGVCKNWKFKYFYQIKRTYNRVLERLVPLDGPILLVAVFVDDVEVGDETGGVPDILFPVGVLTVGVELVLGVADLPLLRSDFSTSFTLSLIVGSVSGGKPKI